MELKKLKLPLWKSEWEQEQTHKEQLCQEEGMQEKELGQQQQQQQEQQLNAMDAPLFSKQQVQDVIDKVQKHAVEQALGKIMELNNEIASLKMKLENANQAIKEDDGKRCFLKPYSSDYRLKLRSGSGAAVGWPR